MSLPLPGPLKGRIKDALIALAFVGADGFIASYPKSGRTWLRFILASYLNDVLRLGLTVDFHTLFQVIPNDILDAERGRRAYRFDDRAEVPLLVASHAPYRRALFRSKKILFMVREPKDLMVSAWFHAARHGSGYSGGMKAFLRDPDLGVARYVRHTNGWAQHLGHHPHLLLSYEQLSADTPGACRAALGFFGLPIDELALEHAITASSFGAMQAIERAAGIAGHRYDRQNDDSLRVRRGKIGGFSDHLDDVDIAFIDEQCRRGLGSAAQDLLARAGIRLVRDGSGAFEIRREPPQHRGREGGPGADTEAPARRPGQQKVVERQ